MNRSAKTKRAHDAFTLVEMLVVIVIIGILTGLITAAVVRARIPARNAVIHAEIKQLDMALTNYKNEIGGGELPPTFIDINIVAERGDATLQPLQDDAREAIVRHLRKAFPRYTPGGVRGNNNPDGRPDNTLFDKFANDVWYAYGRTIDPVYFDPASSLVFWLGGLPEAVPAAGGQWIPAGFHSDPLMPFKPGTPRTRPLFDFDPARIVLMEQHYSVPWDSASPTVPRFIHYYPPKVEAPYAYFKSRRRGPAWQYAYVPTSGTPAFYHYYHSIENGSIDNIAVAYRDPQDPPFWRNHDSCQIIAAGLDGQFGSVAPADVNSLRVTRTGVNFSEGDFDNLANFSEGTLEDEIE